MTYSVRPARATDIPAVHALRQPWVEQGVLLGREKVEMYEQVQEMILAVDENDVVVGCGALHVMWQDLAEIRSVVIDANLQRKGIGHIIIDALVARATQLGIKRIFCLTFETEFFGRHGFEPIADTPVDEETFAELVRSSDEGIAEFLDLARVKQNTLGNTRMLRLL
jgi:amino-acid N-acetyltransferase